MLKAQLFQIVGTLLLFSAITDGGTVSQEIGLFEFYDQFLMEDTIVEVEVYNPEVSNGHLIIISPGGFVAAEEYEAFSKRLAQKGYPVLIPNYQINITSQAPGPAGSGRDRTRGGIDGTIASTTGKDDGGIQRDNIDAGRGSDKAATGVGRGVINFPNVKLLHEILPHLVNYVAESQLPQIDFKDIVILGHSLGGVLIIQDATNTDINDLGGNPFMQLGPISQVYTTLLPDNRSNLWDEYVKGIFLYEGWINDAIPVLEEQFLVGVGSPFRQQLLESQAESTPEDYNASFYIIDNANHYLINNFHGPTQVVQGAIPSFGQENFTTNIQEWETGQEELANIMDYEIKYRLEDSQQAQQQLAQLTHSTDIS